MLIFLRDVYGYVKYFLYKKNLGIVVIRRVYFEKFNEFYLFY